MNYAMNEVAAISLFSVGMASTLTVLFFGFQRTFRSERERALMKRMRCRLNRMILNESSLSE
jgi:hypothetical protein